MSLYDQMAEDLEEVYEDTEGPAEAVTFQAASGRTAGPFKAVVERFGRREIGAADGQTDVRSGVIHVRRADVAEVLEGDAFYLAPMDGGAPEEWKVTGIRGENAAQVEADIIRTGRRRLAAEGDERDRAGGFGKFGR